MDLETASPAMSAPMFHKTTGGNVKDSKVINSGRDTTYNVHNNYNMGVFPDVISFFHVAVHHFVAWTRSADGKQRDEVEISSIIPPDPSSLPDSSIEDLYTRSMLRCRVGYPLYEPDPFSQLSKEYSRNGINVGDVGFIREDGTFDFMFNICPPRNSFINPPNLSGGFSFESSEHSETITMKPLPRATRLFPPTVTRTISGEYICEESEGAVLELPEGAIQAGAINRGRFADLAKRHGVEWYEYTKTRGRDISNGSLYLVTSFTKCTQWGIAVLDRPCNPGQGLTFISSPLGWENSGGFITKVADTNQGDTPNQCIFLRGYKIMIRQDIFDKLPTRQRATRIRGGGGTGLSSRIKKILTGKSSLTRTTMSTVTKSDDVVLHADFNSSPVHPSDLINAALLSQNPDAKVALTHDDVWCDLLRNNFPKLNYAELMNIARLYTSTIDEHGCVSLEKIFDSGNGLDDNSCPLQGSETPVIQGPLITADDGYTPIPATISPTFPRELVECILLLLDIDSMLECRLVNRQFNEIIQSSTLFQDFQSHLEEFNGLRVVGFDSVEGFCSSLSNLYKSVATSSIDRNRWKVTRISILRWTRFFQYESLVAQVVCGRVIVYLRIERKSPLRKAGDPSKATPKTQTSDHSTPSSDNATHSRDTTPLTAPILSSPGRRLALDEITYSKVYTAVASYHETCIEAIRFPEGKGLSLPQIAVLARCVNNFAPIYSTYGENHYWFAHVMIETAKLIETDFTLETMPKRKRRTLSGLLTPDKPTSDVIKVKTMYDEQWAAFIQDIHDSINSYNSEIYQQALQRSLEEEEQKNCAEVERLAAEKDRPIVEAQEEIKD